MVTAHGVVKVLDSGLAKLVSGILESGEIDDRESGPGHPNESHSRT